MSPLERIQKAIDGQRVRFDLKDALEELKVDDLRELIDTAEALVSAVEGADAEIDTWHESEPGEDRAASRDDALEALEEVIEKAEELSVWLEWPNAAEKAQEARLEGMAATQEAAWVEREERRQGNLAFLKTATLEQLDLVHAGDDDELLAAVAARRAELTA